MKNILSETEDSAGNTRKTSIAFRDPAQHKTLLRTAEAELQSTAYETLVVRTVHVACS